jgi:hypothetical protein
MAGIGIVDISELTFALYSSVCIVPLYVVLLYHCTLVCVVISSCQFFLKHSVVSCEAKWPPASA